MSLQLRNFLKSAASNRIFVMWLIVFLAFLATSGFVWMQNDQSIAPPGLRIMDTLWRIFIS